MKNRNVLIISARLAVVAGQVLNGCLGTGIAALLIISLVSGDKFTVLLLHLDTQTRLLTTTEGMRWLMLVGLLAVAATQVILHFLGTMASSLASDDPFIGQNAFRLRAIGCAMLALQGLDFPVILIRHYAPGLGDAVPNTGISPAGWLAVLLVFVLAVIFEKGTAMRNYLEETI